MWLRIMAQRPGVGMAFIMAIGVGVRCGILLAEQPAGWRLCPGIDLHPPCSSCPDDYCRKPMPAPPFLTRDFAPNDYICKPMPSPPLVTRCFVPNDYVAKPMPEIGPLPCHDCDTCGPASSSRSH